MLDLTEQEEKIVLELRNQVKEIIRHKEMTLNILKTAYLFETWMQAEGAGATYSTFCDNFGYEAGENEHRPTTYERVMGLIRLARDHDDQTNQA